MSGEQKHQFHLVEPSPWPAVGSAAGFTLALGAAMYMHDYQYTEIDHDYKELLIPAGKEGSYLLDKNALHIWPRGDFMLMALANLDGSFTCTLFAPKSCDTTVPSGAVVIEEFARVMRLSFFMEFCNFLLVGEASD